jgi:hypothetical protein
MTFQDDRLLAEEGSCLPDKGPVSDAEAIPQRVSSFRISIPGNILRVTAPMA